jgi:hypothetical protein
MMTFKQFGGTLEANPASSSWYLADLGEAQDVMNIQHLERCQEARWRKK